MMPDLEVMIGGKGFQVACQPGEEHFLRSAAAMLDAEATPLITQMGRLPEAKMLLMAGLMLADKTAAVEDELRTLRARVAELEARPVATRREMSGRPDRDPSPGTFRSRCCGCRADPGQGHVPSGERRSRWR